VARRITCFGVIEVLAAVMLERGIPEYIRSDNGPEMTAKAIRKWLAELGAQTLYIEPGSPWEKGYCEAFNGKLQDECLKPEIFTSLKEARIIIEAWRRHYNTVRPHSSLGYRPQPRWPTALGHFHSNRPNTCIRLSSSSNQNISQARRRLRTPWGQCSLSCRALVRLAIVGVVLAWAPKGVRRDR
jgi:hypothetical protein